MGFFELFAGALAALYSVVGSYGVAIILLTLAVRILVLPLSVKSTLQMRESQRNMAKLQPEMKKIRQKHKDDRRKINEETMALYQKHGINPLQQAGGCGWLLLQMPILIGLYYVIRFPLKYLGYAQRPGGGFQPRQGLEGFMAQLQDSALATDLSDSALAVHRFLGLRLDCTIAEVWRGSASLAVPEAACSTGSPLLAAIPYVVLVGLMAFTMYWQQRQMQAVQPADSPQAQQMQTMGKIMPLMFVFFGLSFPSGVVLYWVTTQLWTIGQQRLLLKKAPPVSMTSGDGAGTPEKTAKADKATAKESPGKGSTAKPATNRSGNGSRRSASAKKASAGGTRKKKKR